jgi:birA, biotin-[acetyl-CoA-carboxylase] ligase region
LARGTIIDHLDIEVFEGTLKTRLIGRPSSGSNELHESIDSTNTRAMQLAREGCSEGTVVLARQQTAGRGRLGRQWLSPPDSGIYMSTVLRPSQALVDLPVTTLCIGVAAVRSVFAIAGVEAGLKWVNDLIYDGKKLGGILAEMTAGGENQPALVIGIGINVRMNKDDIPEELNNKMTWLEQAAGAPIDPNALVAELCAQIEDVYFRAADGQIARILDEWRALSVTLGNEILVTSGSTQFRGTAIDITASGALIVETDRGKQEVTGGEITVRNVDGSYC